MQDLEHAIRERAYLLWIADGQPEGNANVYWLAAQGEILATTLNSTETAVSPSMHSEIGHDKDHKKAKGCPIGKKQISRCIAICWSRASLQRPQ